MSSHAPVPLSSITLTEDQQAALDAFHQFLLDPVESVFVLTGYSGCGKTTLVRVLLDRLPGFMRTVHLVNPQAPDYEVTLTATTNKAAENLARITGQSAGTIHSFLGLRVQHNYSTNETRLIPRDPTAVVSHKLIVIDEASYIDKQLLELIFKMVNQRTCKILFIGDPAQLTPVKSTSTPVFQGNYPGAALTEVVRQAAGNPIVDLSTQFRHTVNTGNFFSFTPDGHYVQYMDRPTFNQKLIQEFGRPDWHFSDSKVLGWTNKCVIGFNNYIRGHVQGDPEFQVGDYAICNSYLTIGRESIKTDELVEITDIGPEIIHEGVVGNVFELNGSLCSFMPRSLEERRARIKEAKVNKELRLLSEIETQWVDLRAAYACTVNKAQGSTFDEVFIDLDDIGRCNSGNQIARMMYVAVSRARHHVYLTGDLV